MSMVVPVNAQTIDWPNEDPPPPLLRREVVFPEFETRTLDNGLRVVYVGHHEQPAVNVRLLLRAGASSDPSDKLGVASLVGQLLDQGTTTRTAPEIAGVIDNVGGALVAGAAGELSFVNVLVMKDSFDLGLDMLADVTRRPAFSPQEIERQRQQVLSSLQVSYDDPAYVATVVFNRLVYGFHRYGMPSSGTPESVRAITRDDLVAFHRMHYLPNNAVIAVVGDVSAEEAFQGVERVLGDWERGELPAPRVEDVPAPTRRLVVIDRPGAVQTTVRAGHVALPRADPDFLAFDLAIKILGGEGGNRLGNVLRSQRSLTYAASADLAGRQLSGDFMAKTDTRSVATAEALRLTVDEISRMRRERVHPQELQGAQDYLAGNFPITIETPNAIATQVLEAILFGLDLDELERYPQRINRVTVADIQRVAEKHLKPASLSIVLVGDASTFVQDLPGVGFDQFENVSLAELDLSTADLRRAR
jgi:zinc protease|tara:strand:- start:522 stop:1946 length:1425 start_codon:yes stop_codon:yes gene_type:complete